METFEQVKPVNFFRQHPIFRQSEFVAAHSGSGSRSRQTSTTVLKQHLAAGNLILIRRGLYATVPPGLHRDEVRVDPYLLASMLAPDAVVCLHAALQFHGKVYSIWNRFHYFSRTRPKPLRFQGSEFLAIQSPRALCDLPDLGGGIQKASHAGGLVRVTTLERTLVDLLDPPARHVGWEETWRSLEMVEYFDIDILLQLVKQRDSAIAAARVGFFLEQGRNQWMVSDEQLDAFQSLAPNQPLYMDAKRASGRLVHRWNLIVPERLLHRDWLAVR